LARARVDAGELADGLCGPTGSRAGHVRRTLGDRGLYTQIYQDFYKMLGLSVKNCMGLVSSPDMP
jgi:hypothetical protein